MPVIQWDRSRLREVTLSIFCRRGPTVRRRTSKAVLDVLLVLIMLQCPIISIAVNDGASRLSSFRVVSSFRTTHRQLRFNPVDILDFCRGTFPVAQDDSINIGTRQETVNLARGSPSNRGWPVTRSEKIRKKGRRRHFRKILE